MNIIKKIKVIILMLESHAHGSSEHGANLWSKSGISIC